MSTRFVDFHNVEIRTRYGETDRECYCTVTNGTDHHENEFPWIAESELADEKPLDIPMRPGENADSYYDRIRNSEVWMEGWLHRVKSTTDPENLEAELLLAALSGESANPYLDH